MGCKFCVVVLGLMMWAVVNLDLAASVDQNMSNSITNATTNAATSTNITTGASKETTTVANTTVAPTNKSITTVITTTTKSGGCGIYQWNGRMSMFLHVLLFGAIFSILVSAI
uniref:Uncharacterized protein n=1 Tax=Octopus bimaculoides TaxID=37653 RepID=A0A0L8I990_OCTBM